MWPLLGEQEPWWDSLVGQLVTMAMGGGRDGAPDGGRGLLSLGLGLQRAGGATKTPPPGLGLIRPGGFRRFASAGGDRGTARGWEGLLQLHGPISWCSSMEMGMIVWY